MSFAPNHCTLGGDDFNLPVYPKSCALEATDACEEAADGELIAPPCCILSIHAVLSTAFGDTLIKWLNMMLCGHSDVFSSIEAIDIFATYAFDLHAAAAFVSSLPQYLQRSSR